MLRCSDVSVSYGKGRNSVKPLQNVTAVFPEQATAVMGPSGSGKSTLLRVLSGMQAPDLGFVELDDKPIACASPGTVDPRVSMIHQDLRLIDFLTVDENLLLAAELRGQQVQPQRLRTTLAKVGLDGFGGRRPTTLSGGEQQRVAIARSLLLNSRMLLADEPTGSLDETNSLAVAALLRDLAREEGAVVVVATHDASVASALTRTLHLSAGSFPEDPA